MLRRLRVFENGVLMRIFGPKKDEVMGGWRKLHKEELRDFYSSSSRVRITKSRKMRWGGHVASMGEDRKERMSPLGRPRRRWADNIKMDLEEMRSDGVEWICLAQDRYRWRALVNAVVYFRGP
jgi:hypothetical protein